MKDQQSSEEIEETQLSPTNTNHQSKTKPKNLTDWEKGEVKTVEKEEESFSKKYYAFIALGAGLFFGVQIFLYQVVVDSQHKNFHFSLFLPVFLGFIITSAAYHVREALNLKRKYGFYWAIEKSVYVKQDDEQNTALKDFESMQIDHHHNSVESEGSSFDQKRHLQLNYINIFGMLARSATSLLGFFMNVCVMYTSTKANINYSLIINIYGVTPFLTAISFYFIFKEKLNKLHIIGMISIFICIAVTSQSQPQKSIQDSQANESLPIIVPIICAIIATCFFTLNSLISRYTINKGTITSAQMLADGYLIQAFIFIILFCIIECPYPIYTILSIAGVSVIGTIGTYCVNEAVVYGIAGPAQALAESQSLFLLLLEITILAKIPNSLQVIGFIFGVIGGLFIAFDTLPTKGESSKTGKNLNIPH